MSEKGKAGNPGYGVLMSVKRKVTEMQGLYWEQMERALQDEEDKGMKRFAMGEMTKLMMKMLPSKMEHSGEDGKNLDIHLVVGKMSDEQLKNIVSE